MTYGANEVQRDLALVREGAASFEVRARLEQHLLEQLRTLGTKGVAELLLSLPDYNFSPGADATTGSDASYVSGDESGPHLVIAMHASPDLVWVNVTVEELSSSREEQDPRHRAFYALWEDMLGLPDAKVAELDPARKAVFLIGLLEAEVMNGGLGQYLTNTNGVHFDGTIRCLTRIGAEKTRMLLIEAKKLASDADSYVAAWESKSSDFSRLDEQFLESGEDLVGLTADVFLDLDS
jgi:hypothetical protein